MGKKRDSSTCDGNPRSVRIMPVWSLAAGVIALPHVTYIHDISSKNEASSLHL